MSQLPKMNLAERAIENTHAIYNTEFTNTDEQYDCLFDRRLSITSSMSKKHSKA